MSELRLETPRRVERITAIKVIAARGRGILGDPIREVTQYWDFEGNLLAECDPSAGVSGGTPTP